MNIMIAGGGTGGHLFPGIAIADEFLKQNQGNSIAFIGSAQGIEAEILPKLKFRLHTTIIRGFKGKGVLDKISSVFSIPLACVQAACYLIKYRTDIIVGLGGYISFPAVVAGAIMGVPVVIHEQNSVPGLANRMLGKLAKRVFISYEKSSEYFQHHKAVFSGMPVRTHRQHKNFTAADERFCVLILGGSQGARQINSAVIEALPFLAEMKNKIRFIHQSGASDVNMVRESYLRFGLSVQVHSFIEEIFACYEQAGLIISRAGAGTLAEQAMFGRASVLIPYPFAAGNHQKKNAEVFVSSGAALMIHPGDLTGARIASLIADLMGNREKLQQMENSAAGLSMPKAAETIASECMRLTGLKG